MLAFWEAKRDIDRRFLHRVADRNLDPPLELTNVLEIGVEPAPIAGAEIALEQTKLTRDRIENAGILLATRNPLLRTRAVAEQALEGHTRIDFCRERLGRRRPGDGVRVRAAVTPVAIAEV